MPESNVSPTTVSAHRKGPSRGFWVGMFGVFLFAVVLASVATAAARDGGGPSTPEVSPTPVPTVEVSHAPRMTTPPDGYALNR